MSDSEDTPAQPCSLADTARIELAQETIGQSEGNDWTIDPTSPPSSLLQTAPTLAAVLTGSRLESWSARFSRADTAAGLLQNKYKRASRNANLSVLATTVLSALSVATGGLTSYLPEALLSQAFTVLSLGGVAAGSLGTMWMFQIRDGLVLQAWKSQRAKAEAARLSYFEEITTPRGDIDLTLLQLEYFRRYQLEVQLTYFEGRGKRHGRAADRILGWGMLATLLATFANSAGGMTGFEDGGTSVIALGVLAGAFGAFAANTEAVNQDKQGAERCERTLATLEEVRSKLSDTRQAVASGALDVLPAFVHVVHQELLLEHREWLDNDKERNEAFEALENQAGKALGEEKPAGEDTSRGV